MQGGTMLGSKGANTALLPRTLRLVLFGIALAVAPLRLIGQTTTTRRPTAKPPVTPAQQVAQSKYKGIWEPISYPEDLALSDVFFATADEGWVAGGATNEAGAVILHTADGGDHWEIQLGDPQSSENGYKELRFLDRRQGWAVQRRSGGNPDRLLHTRDGKNWIMIGPMPGPHMDYMFTSERTGVVIREGSELDITTDGGKSWKPAFECAAKVQVNGLWQNVGCRWGRLQFLTPSIGFAVGFNNQNLFLAKTIDGGATWKLQAVVERNENWPKNPDVFFLDENTGFIGAEQAYKSSDGGQTWTGITASSWRPLHLRFADPEVGWAFDGKKVTFTTDGGNRWNSREYPFPVEPEALSLPRRDRGYIVGAHGMIYRYRVVPSEYTAKGMIPAPLLSGLDPALDLQVQQLAQQVQQLAKDTGAPPIDFMQDTGGASPSGPGSAPTFSSDTSAPGSTSTSFNTGSGVSGGTFPGAVPGCPAINLPGTSPVLGSSPQPISSSGTASPAPASASPGGFTQDTEVSAGFVQDTNTATATVTTVSNTVPQFVSKYRNLNLMLTGLQVATQMPATVQCMKQSFMALKNVKNPQAAIAAVVNIQGQMTGLMQMMRLAFQKH
jgi:photosystem II stability/assembly factor-like uncharacterized protein